jgi:hypothetical protein
MGLRRHDKLALDGCLTLRKIPESRIFTLSVDYLAATVFLSKEKPYKRNPAKTRN